MKQAGIYRIVVSRPSGPMFYIGQSVQPYERWNQHLRALEAGRHDNRKMLAVFRKYGRESFSFSIVLRCRPAANELTLYEQIVLDLHRATFGDPAILNTMKECVLSHLGVKRSAATVRRMSESQKGRAKPPEAVARMAASLTGLKHSIETRRRQSDRMKKEPPNPKFVAAREKALASPKRLINLRAALQGKPKVHSPETIAKISLSLTGKRQSQDSNAKRSAALRGRHHSPDHIAKRIASRAANRASQHAS